MVELVTACGNLRILINRIEEAVAFDIPLNQVQQINSATQFAEAFLNALNNELVS